MTKDPQGPSATEGRIQKVLDYRVAVRLLSASLLELAETGEICEKSRALLKEASHGRKTR